MAWTLATAVPLLGAAIITVADLAGADFRAGTLAGADLFLIGTALSVGLLAIRAVTRSLAESVGSVGSALRRIEHGELDTRVAVDDGSEVGQLQAGFNRMATGLQERERLREAFGAFVDPDLGERILREGTDLAGEEVDLSVLFLDVRGFTTLAERTSARDVVARLNALYDRVVPIVREHGGHANKFIGDGMLAVFGAPERHDDHADRAVAAALEIAREAHDELRIGLGVNSGRVLVGTVGGGGRLDFTVIGDPVNTAARVEAATRQTGDDVLITRATRRRLRGDHGSWEPREPIPLKGKSDPVELFAPAR
jgi:adenylate cyclase